MGYSVIKVNNKEIILYVSDHHMSHHHCLWILFGNVKIISKFKINIVLRYSSNRAVGRSIMGGGGGGGSYSYIRVLSN